jgi:CheY-like chemotaxis protein
MKVLIIDDDIVVHELSSGLLMIVDHDCTIASSFNGKQGVEFMSDPMNDVKNLPDVILLDMKMPVLDGWGFLEKLQRMTFIDGYTPSIYILSEKSYEHVKGMTFPIKGEYLKPLNFSAINQIIRQASA